MDVSERRVFVAVFSSHFLHRLSNLSETNTISFWSLSAFVRSVSKKCRFSIFRMEGKQQQEENHLPCCCCNDGNEEILLGDRREKEKSENDVWYKALKIKLPPHRNLQPSVTRHTWIKSCWYVQGLSKEWSLVAWLLRPGLLWPQRWVSRNLGTIL